MYLQLTCLLESAGWYYNDRERADLAKLKKPN